MNQPQKYGQFCWSENVTHNPNTAKTFYAELFGWTSHDDPLPSGGVYTLFSKDSQLVSAAYQMMPEQKKMNVPPHWSHYVAVEDVNATANKAKTLGATVIVPPFEVMDQGSMTVIQDPTGAVLSFWQPKKHTGYGNFGEQTFGTPCWHELMTTNTDIAGGFYSKLLGWTLKHSTNMGFTYTEFQQKGTSLAGMMAITKEMGPVPPNWMVYYTVANCDQSAEKVKSLSGKILMGPQDIPTIGRFAVIQDPAGAVCSIIQLAQKM